MDIKENYERRNLTVCTRGPLFRLELLPESVEQRKETGLEADTEEAEALCWIIPQQNIRVYPPALMAGSALIMGMVIKMSHARAALFQGRMTRR